jgi:murein DD-endopeptidase MepM/ murein hydrolase activator NlpD
MKFFLRVFSSFLIVFLLFSCSQKPAKIVNLSKNIYSKNNAKNRDVKKIEKLKNREVEVAESDTVYTVSKKYQVPIQDIIKQNNLKAPYNLKDGEKLILPPPTYHEVKSGETLYAISRQYNMKIDNIIEINDLKEPYSVKAGQKLKIANVAEKKTDEKLAKVPEIKTAKAEIKSPETIVEKVADKFNHFSWPVRGTIVSKFGPKSGGLYNDGINIKAKEGSDVKASEDGVVAYVGNELKGYGNLIIVKHDDGWITAYAHLGKWVVKRGESVKKSQKIGNVGATGNVNSPQLYFGLRKGRDAVNPENYLK